MPSLGTVIICLILIAIVGGIIYSLYRNKKKGKSCCGGDCSCCGGGCHIKNK